MFLILAEQELVGHPRDVIAYDKMAWNLPRGLLLRLGHRVSLFQIIGKQRGQASDGAGGVLGDEWVVINVREEESFQLGVLRARPFAESRQALWNAADLIRGARAGLLDKRFRVGDEIADQMVNHMAQGLIEFQARASAGMPGLDPGVDIREKRDFVAQGVQIEQIGFQRVVEVGGVVSDFVNPVDELRFEGRTQFEQILGQLRVRIGGVIPGMLHDAFADFKRQIEAVEFDVTMFEVLHDAKRVQVVIKAAAVDAHQLVEFSFAGMAKGRVANIVNQCQRLNEFGVDAQGGCYGAGNLGYFKRVGQAIAKVVGEAGAEDLRLRFEPPERPGMDDTVAVARVLAAVSVSGFRRPPAAGGCRVYSPGSVGAKRFDCRNLRRSGGTLGYQDCGASSPSPRSASSATFVFG